MLIKDPRGSWEGVPGGDVAVIAAGRCSAGKADRPNGLARSGSRSEASRRNEMQVGPSSGPAGIGLVHSAAAVERSRGHSARGRRKEGGRWPLTGGPGRSVAGRATRSGEVRWAVRAKRGRPGRVR